MSSHEPIRWVSRKEIESILGIDYTRQNQFVKAKKIELADNPLWERGRGYSRKDLFSLLDYFGYKPITSVQKGREVIYLCDKKKVLVGAGS